MENFSELKLDKSLMQSITRMQFKVPTPIQAQAIPPALLGKDVLGTAQTGTGKTAAFVIPILEKLLNDIGEKQANIRGRLPEALVIAPTRELADQIDESIKVLSKYTKFSSIPLYGGVNKNPQDSKLARGIDIVVACPGRLLDHIREETIDVSNLIFNIFSTFSQNFIVE